MWLVASFASAQTPAAKPPTAAERLVEARGLILHGKFDEAVAACEAIVSDPSAAAAQKRAALETLVDIHRRHKKNVPKAIEALDQLAKMPAADPQAVYAAAMDQADVYWEANQKNEALAKLRQYVQTNAAQRKLCAQAQGKLTGWLWTLQNWRDAYAEAAKAIEFDASDDKRVAAALAQMGEAAALFKDDEKCIAAYRRMLEPQYAAQRLPQEIHHAGNRIAEALARLKRTDELLAHYAAFMKFTPDMAVKQDMAMRRANALYLELNRPAEALAAYEEVFTESYGLSDRWFEAQGRIVEILRKLNRPQEALQAARICLGAAPDAGAVQAWTGAIMELMREIDKQALGPAGEVTRANLFLDFQKYGPAGKDQTPGTPDDLQDPLAAVPYPSYPGREQAFAKARASAGDSAQASRHRAMTFVFTGKPAEALKHFADAFRRCGGNDMRAMATDLVCVGVRGVQGHPINLGRCWQFMLMGPAGLDGKPGTADDLLDPFQAMGLAAAAPGTGGLAEIPPDQLKPLQDAVPRLADMADSWRQQPGRREAISALARAHVALCDWDGPMTLLGATGISPVGVVAPGSTGGTPAAPPKVKDWYVRQMLLSTQEFQAFLIDGALGAAKGGQLHLVGVRQFHADLDAAAEKAGIRMPQWPRGRDVVKALVDLMSKPPDLRPKQPPFPPPKKQAASLRPLAVSPSGDLQAGSDVLLEALRFPGSGTAVAAVSGMGVSPMKFATAARPRPRRLCSLRARGPCYG